MLSQLVDSTTDNDIEMYKYMDKYLCTEYPRMKNHHDIFEKIINLWKVIKVSGFFSKNYLFNSKIRIIFKEEIFLILLNY